MPRQHRYQSRFAYVGQFLIHYSGDIIAFLAFIVTGYGAPFGVAPVRRGFFCDDETIRAPYSSRQTITHQTLLSLCFGLPAFAAIVTKFSLTNRHLQRISLDTIPFVFGFAGTKCITSFVKTITGRMRPFFIDFCIPDSYRTHCFESGAIRTGIYITNFTCTRDLSAASSTSSSSMITFDEARRSFFSGHSSLIAFSMCYLTFYLQTNSASASSHHNLFCRSDLFRSKLSRIARATVQLILVNIALFVGYSRITDNYHHWSDVLLGLFAGAAIAVYTYRTITPRFKLRKSRRKCKRKCSDHIPSQKRYSNNNDYMLLSDQSFENIQNISKNNENDLDSINSPLLVSNYRPAVGICQNFDCNCVDCGSCSSSSSSSSSRNSIVHHDCRLRTGIERNNATNVARSSFTYHFHPQPEQMIVNKEGDDGDDNRHLERHQFYQTV